MQYRNVSFATAASLRDILADGSVLCVRGEETRELRNRITVLRHPRERCLFLPYRGNDIFASLAETFWVLRGRNDIEWLQNYLTRVRDFSDDGRTWRAAYGPRLRNWNGIDQLEKTRRLLLDDRLTRRAVMTIFDPDRDFVQSKDIPCNNWLHWLFRDDRLHLNIAVRSNDVVWGFSGVNSFAWSVLHEAMAFWIGAPVGEATYFASSFHVYRCHYQKAAKVVAHFAEFTCYDFGVSPASFQTPWEAFDAVLDAWFTLEEEIRRAPEAPISEARALLDPLMNGSLQILRLYHGAQRGWDTDRLRDELAALPETDLTAAAYEYFGRKRPEILKAIPHPSIAAFFNDYEAARKGDPHARNHVSIKAELKALHLRKSAAYGNAWKRRGELTSVLANIARKVDRLEHYAAQSTLLADESVCDTAIDLLVYVTKYRLFLMDLAPELARPALPAHASAPFSDDPSSFDALIDGLHLPDARHASSTGVIGKIISLFAELHHEASTVGSLPTSRMEHATRLSDLALLLVVTLASEKLAGS